MTTVLYTNSHLFEIRPYLTTIRASHVDVLFSYLLNQTGTRPLTDAEMTAYLDAINGAGLKAMLPIYDLGKLVVSGRVDKVLSAGELATLTAYVNKWKTHPAVWGWYADDEGGTEYPISTRQQVYNAIKAAHPAGVVWETHWHIVAGAYSPDVHDVFAFDAYVYNYNTSLGGCVDPDTGELDEAVEALAIADFTTRLTDTRAALVAAGETNYVLCMQAFGQALDGTLHSWAMPPAGGLQKMWAAAGSTGWDGYGAAWFLWLSNDVTTMPNERLLGVGKWNYGVQRAELSAIAATMSAGGSYPAAPPYPMPDTDSPHGPVYSVLIGAAGAEPSEDITELVDLDTLHRSLSERGEASATIDIPVASANEVPNNFLTRDATLAIDVDGEREWLGHVVAVHKPKPQDLSYVLDCAGGWDTLHHCAPWCKGFVETRYDAVTELPPSLFALYSSVLSPTTAIDASTDGEVLLTLPKGTTLKSNQCKFLYLWMLGGLADGFSIKRITYDVACSGSGVLRWNIQAWGPDPVHPVDYFSVATGTTVPWSYALDTGTMSVGGPLTVLVFMLSPATGDVAAQTSDQTFQVRNIRVYIDRTTAPRVDEIVAAIDAGVRPGAPAPVTESIGAPLTAFMCDPFTTPADGIAVALTKAAVPPLCGIVQNQLVIQNRPTAPPDATRLWTVSEQLTPGLEWGVEVDEEQSVDYVGVAYGLLGDALFPDGTPRIAYYPSVPPNAAARTALVDGGDLTAAEAAFYAQQGYYYLHNFASGPVTIPYVVQDANGNERPADVIRQWDWVQNVGSLDAETAGPFLVSEVEHQGHIATLTIGAAEAYAYNGPDRMPTKGRYVGGYRTRRRTKKRVSFETYWHWKHRAYYKKHKKYPSMPKKHAKRGTTHGWEWIDHEGRYV
jgi:hypothetical protein